MFRHTIPIGRISGISIDLDYSWFVIVGLMTWLLAVSYYPLEFRGWSTAEYWLMGGVTAIMLFVSVLIHELGHSVVARRYGISVPRITLFLFGGVSQIATGAAQPGRRILDRDYRTSRFLRPGSLFLGIGTLRGLRNTIVRLGKIPGFPELDSRYLQPYPRIPPGRWSSLSRFRLGDDR